MSNKDYEAGYVAALLQLQNKLRQENPNPKTELKKVLQHIQDLIATCDKCGSKLFGDGSCLTCEMTKDLKKRVIKK